ncbi:hypothetical protein FPCIR_12508, partial [Fusarium pseudocircinatum]
MRTAILEGTPSTSFNKKSKTEPLRPPVPATLPVGHQKPGGLRIKKQREYAAIRDAGMSRPSKHAAIALKYNLDLQEGIFGASSTGRDGDDEASSKGLPTGDTTARQTSFATSQ